MQPDWLPVGRRWLPTHGARLLAGLVGLIGGLGAGLVTGLDFGPGHGLLAGLSFGLFGGLVAALIGGVTGYSQEIVPIETVRWSWSKCLSELLLPSRRSLRSGLGFGLSAGLIGGLVAGLGLGLGAWLVVELGFGLERGLISGLDLVLDLGLGSGLNLGLLSGLDLGLGAGLVYKLGTSLTAGLSGSEITTKTVPNEGIHRSARMAVGTGLGAGLLTGLGAWLGAGLFSVAFSERSAGLGLKLDAGLFVGLFAGLRYGGRACLQHLVLRLALRYHSSIPRHYADFLDYAAERLFLRKVGGSYLFIHRLLQDYFAARYMAPGDGIPQEPAGQEQSSRN